MNIQRQPTIILLCRHLYISIELTAKTTDIDERTEENANAYKVVTINNKLTTSVVASRIDFR